MDYLASTPLSESVWIIFHGIVLLKKSQSVKGMQFQYSSHCLAVL